MKIKDKSVMVLGGCGFIGSHLVDTLIIEKPKEIVVVDNMFLGKESNLKEAKQNFDALRLYKENVEDFDVMKNIMKTHNPDVVFNLAVLPLPYSLEHPKQCNDRNVEMVSTICELQRLGFFKTLIHFSSSEAYGSAQYRPMDDKHPLGPSTPYAASKASGDILALSYHKTFGNDISVLRPFNNYGPRQNEGSYAGVIPLTIQRIMQGESPIIQSDGTQTRDFIYATDTAKMAIEMYKREVAGEVINVGGGAEISIKYLVELIMDLMDCNKDIQYEPARAGDVKRHIANIYKAEDLLDFKQTISFEEGMKNTVDWYTK